MRSAHRTIRTPKCMIHLVEDYPNAGPRCNITGMKNLYWGKDAYVVICGQYAYNVPYSVYTRCMFLSD